MQLVDPRTGEVVELHRTRRSVRRYKLKDDHEPIYWAAIVLQAATIGLLV